MGQGRGFLLVLVVICKSRSAGHRPNSTSRRRAREEKARRTGLSPSSTFFFSIPSSRPTPLPSAPTLSGAPEKPVHAHAHAAHGRSVKLEHLSSSDAGEREERLARVYQDDYWEDIRMREYSEGEEESRLAEEATLVGAPLEVRCWDQSRSLWGSRLSFLG